MGILNTGTGPDTGTGETLLSAATKIDAKLTELAAIPPAVFTRYIEENVTPVFDPNRPFARASEGYMLSRAFDIRQFAVDVPRVSRKGQFYTDEVQTANLLVNHTGASGGQLAAAGETVALAANTTYTFECHGGIGRAKLTLPTGSTVTIGGESVSGLNVDVTYREPVTFQTGAAGNLVVTYSGHIKRAWLYVGSFMEQFRITQVEADSAFIPLGSVATGNRAFHFQGAFREIGRSQEFFITFEDGSVLEMRKDASGQIYLIGTFDGAVFAQTRLNGKIWPGCGCDLQLILTDKEAQWFVNGFIQQSLPLRRPLVGLATLSAHKWRGIIYSLDSFADSYSVMGRILATQAYSFFPLTKIDFTDNVQFFETVDNIGQGNWVLRCNAADTIDIVYPNNFDAATFVVGNQVKIEAWSGGLVGGLNVVGQTYSVATITNSGSNKILRLTATGAVVDSADVSGRLTTIRTQGTAGTAVPNGLLWTTDLITTLNAGDSVEFTKLKIHPSLTVAGVSLAGKTFLGTTTKGRLTGTWGGTGQIYFHGQPLAMKVVRANTVLPPIVADMDQYSEAIGIPPYNSATKDIYAPGSIPAGVVNMTTGYSPPNDRPIFWLGRTTGENLYDVALVSFSNGATVGMAEMQGGLCSQANFVHTSPAIYFDGLHVDRTHLNGDADLFGIRNVNGGVCGLIFATNACNTYNKGGQGSGVHADRGQIYVDTRSQVLGMVATNEDNTGTYQNIGQMACQQGIGDATMQPSDVTPLEYYRDFQTGAPANTTGPGALANWIEGSVTSGLQKNGNRPHSLHYENLWFSMKNYLDTEVRDQISPSNTQSKVPGYGDPAGNIAVGQIPRTPIKKANGAWQYPPALGFVGDINIGTFPGRLRRGANNKDGGVGQAGRKYHPMNDSFASGYTGGRRQVPLSFRPSLPLNVWYEGGTSMTAATTATVTVTDIDKLNPPTKIELFVNRSAGAAAAAQVSENPADLLAANAEVTLNAMPADGKITFPLASGIGGYARVVVTRANPNDRKVSSLITLRAA